MRLTAAALHPCQQRTIPLQLSRGVGLQASTAQRAPSPALPLMALPPGLPMGAAPQHPQSAAAALQQAGLAAPAQPGQQGWPADQGATLLAHLQSQARSNMGQMRPQDPSGMRAHLLLQACKAARPVSGLLELMRHLLI